MVVDPDPKKQRCEGILGATGTAGAEAGGKVVSMVNQLTSLLLAKSVVGETHEIDTTNIKVRFNCFPFWWWDVTWIIFLALCVDLYF